MVKAVNNWGVNAAVAIFTTTQRQRSASRGVNFLRHLVFQQNRLSRRDPEDTWTTSMTTMQNNNITPKALKGVVTSFIQYGCQIGLQVLLAPMVIKIAGQEVLGAYAVIMQAVAYLALVDMGFSLAMTRFLSQAYGYSDGGMRFEAVLATSQIMLVFTNTVYAILLLLLAFFCKDAFSLSEGVAAQTKLGLSLLAGWSFLRTPLMIYQQGLNASQNMSTANLINIVGNFIRLLTSVGLILLGMGLVGIICANILGEVSIHFLCFHQFRKHCPNIHPKWNGLDRVLTKEMFGFGRHALTMNLAWRLIAGTDSIVVGLLYGAAATSVYYTTQMPSIIGYNLVNRLVDNFGPGINALYAQDALCELRVLFLRLHRYAFGAVVPLLLGILLLNQQLVAAWVGPDQYAGNLMTTFLAGVCLLLCLGHVSCIFLVAKGEIKSLARLSLIEGIINLGLSFLLGHYVGLAGVMLATLIAHLPMFLFLQARGMRSFGIKLLAYTRYVVWPFIIPGGISMLCVLLFIKIFNYSNWVSFGLGSSVLLLVYICMSYFFALDTREQAWLKHQLQLAGQRFISRTPYKAI